MLIDTSIRIIDTRYRYVDNWLTVCIFKLMK